MYKNILNDIASIREYMIALIKINSIYKYRKVKNIYENEYKI